MNVYHYYKTDELVGINEDVYDTLNDLNNFEEKIKMYHLDVELLGYGESTDDNFIIDNSAGVKFTKTGWNGKVTILDKDAIVIKVDTTFDYYVINFAIKKTLETLNLAKHEDFKEHDLQKYLTYLKGYKITGGSRKTAIKDDGDKFHVEGVYLWYKFNQKLYRDYFIGHDITNNFCGDNGDVALGIEDILKKDIDRKSFEKLLIYYIVEIIDNNKFSQELIEFNKIKESDIVYI